MAILDSVKKLAEKLGAETNGRDITDQLNKINRHLDSAASSDIAEGVSKFADAESGGSGGSGISPSYITFGVFNGSMPPGSGTLDNRCSDLIIVAPDDNGAVSYSAVNTVGSNTNLYNYAFVYGENVKRINLEAFQYNHSVTFKAGEDFEGFFYHDEQMSFEGTITAGTWYNALYSYNGVVVETNEYLGYVPMD